MAQAKWAHREGPEVQEEGEIEVKPKRGLSYAEKKSASESRSAVSNSLRHHGLYSPWNSPGQNTGVGSLSLLQGIFPTQRSNPDLHWTWIIYQLSHKGSPRTLEWVAQTNTLEFWFKGRSLWCHLRSIQMLQWQFLKPLRSLPAPQSGHCRCYWRIERRPSGIQG